MKVLVVDDEQDVQILFEQKFRKELRAGSLNFDFAFSGEDAITYLENQDTSKLMLILSDINMPGINGIELLKIVKQKYPDQRVFMITAYGDEHNFKSAMEHGADDYFTKPIEFDVLKTKISQFLNS